MEPLELRNRCMGAVMGFAIGDALGMPAQFLTTNQIRRYYGSPITCFLPAHAGHASDFLPKGSYTDDTQLMLATAESIIEFREVQPAQQAEALLSWYVNSIPHRTPMRANIKACKHLSAGKSWTRSGVFSNCCGAAVRMPPVGMALYGKPDLLTQAALETAHITHTEPRALAGAAAVACLTARLVRATDRCLPGDQVLEAADRVAPIDKDMAAMIRWVTQIAHLEPAEALFEIGTGADALEGIPAAIYCFLKYPRDYTRAVLAAVNGGDAADTIASLTGAFVGALNGIDGIPGHWQKNVENADILAAIGQNLAEVAAQMNDSQPE